MKYWLLILLWPVTSAQGQSYFDYHNRILSVEAEIGRENYEEALQLLGEVVDAYDYVFLKHYKIAAQLAVHTGNSDLAYQYLEAGISSGWTMKQIKKSKYLKPLRQNKERWASLVSNYDELRSTYTKRIDQDLAEEVHAMFKRDQWLALKSLTKFGEKRFDRWAERKFAPLSEAHMARLNEMMDNEGYPGEQLVGNEMWMMDMLLHHVSMTQAYTINDTIFHYLTPKLKSAIAHGQMSPYSYAVAYDWYIAVKSGHSENSFGYINELEVADIPKSDDLRETWCLRSITLRDKLEAIEKKTGMDFYLESEVLMSDQSAIAEGYTTAIASPNQ